MPTELLRDLAVERLEALIGQDLRPLADKFGVTIFKPGGGFNKGWAGLVCEAFLGAKPNSRSEADFLGADGKPWELKAIPFYRLRTGELTTKETMAITMINEKDVAVTPFEESRLWHKLKSFILVGREFKDRQESSSPLLSVAAFDLDDENSRELVEQIKADYEFVQNIIKTAPTPEEGLFMLSGKMGVFVQPRTKGQGGKAKKTRAFYLRTQGIKKLLTP